MKILVKNKLETGYIVNKEKCYQTRLSKEVFNLVTDGDIIHWWQVSTQGLFANYEGVIVKPNGKKYFLIGCRDIGIHTQTDLILNLKKVKKNSCVWQTDFTTNAEKIHVIKAPWGVWYRHTGPIFGLWGVKDEKELFSMNDSVEKFNGQSIAIDRNTRLQLWTNPIDAKNWITGYLIPQKKVVKKINTDKPLTSDK